MLNKNSKFSIGCLIYTYDRIDDALINMELIRNLWGLSKVFAAIKIFHAYNGKKSWYRKKYLEDELIRLPQNPGHFQGAAELIDIGIQKFHIKNPEIRYLIILAADTWCTKPNYLAKVIHQMHQKKMHLATCPWGLPTRYNAKNVGIATDFFVIDVPWAIKFKFFPLNYNKFFKKYQPLLSYLRPGSNVSVEKLALARFHDASFREYNDNLHRQELARQSIFILKERQPVHTGKNANGYWARKFYWPKIGLVTHHQPVTKQKILKSLKVVEGRYIKKLIKSKNLDYYNNGKIKRLSFD